MRCESAMACSCLLDWQRWCHTGRWQQELQGLVCFCRITTHNLADIIHACIWSHAYTVTCLQWLSAGSRGGRLHASCRVIWHDAAHHGHVERGTAKVYESGKIHYTEGLETNSRSIELHCHALSDVASCWTVSIRYSQHDQQHS